VRFSKSATSSRTLPIAWTQVPRRERENRSGEPGFLEQSCYGTSERHARASWGSTGTAAHVREKLMVFANGDRETYVSVATLAAAIGRSEKTVRRALSRLYAAGLVTPRIEVTEWGRRNVYRLVGPRSSGANEARARTSAADQGQSVPSRAQVQNVPMGRDTVTRPPPPETLLTDRDQKNVPPPPPRSVVVSEPFPVEESVLAQWREAKLPPVDPLRARVTVRRRVAEGVSDQDLVDAVRGARARSDGDGWPGVFCAFAVVMARPEYVREYAQRGREAREPSQRRQRADRERRAQECAGQREAQSARSSAAIAGLAKVAAMAATGHYTGASQLARELTQNDARAP
jgi:DNA-binding transcriptional ArsR family regulator